MKFLPRVVEAEHRGDSRLRLVFNDGSENTIDFSQWFEGPMFEPLKTQTFFNRYFIDGGHRHVAERCGHRAGNAVRGSWPSAA
jgi:hypothetical protein